MHFERDLGKMSLVLPRYRNMSKAVLVIFTFGCDMRVARREKLVSNVSVFQSERKWEMCFTAQVRESSAKVYPRKDQRLWRDGMEGSISRYPAKF